MGRKDVRDQLRVVQFVRHLSEWHRSGPTSRGLIRSFDQGENWNLTNTIFSNPPTALTQATDGSLFAATPKGVQKSTDYGLNWESPLFTSTLVTAVAVSKTGVLFAGLSDSMRIFRSTDAGKTWVSIKGDLPANGPVLAIAEDHVNPNLLFVGTEFALFFTLNGGQKWTQLKGGLPTIAVRDLAIQKRESDLALATFGRGFYILDDYTPLRNLKPEMLSQEASLFSVKDALMYIEARPLGGRGKGFQGESFYSADNPPFGAVFTYHLKESLKTKKERRQEAEKDAEKKGVAAPYPTFEQLKAEDQEEAPAILMTVTDAEGRVVRKLTGRNSSGMNRVTWDLRSPAPTPPQQQQEADFFDEGPSGPLVMPGEYKVTLAKRVEGKVTQLAGPVSFNVVVEGQASMKAEDRKVLVDFQQKVARLQRAVTGASRLSADVKTRLGQIKLALHQTPAADEKLREDARTIEAQLDEITTALRGDNSRRSRNEASPVSIGERVANIVDDQRMSTSRPTQTHLDQFKIAGELFSAELAKLRTLVETDLTKLEKAMEAAGSPWTPGRIPEWKEE